MCIRSMQRGVENERCRVAILELSMKEVEWPKDGEGEEEADEAGPELSREVMVA